MGSFVQARYVHWRFSHGHGDDTVGKYRHVCGTTRTS